MIARHPSRPFRPRLPAFTLAPRNVRRAAVVGMAAAIGLLATVPASAANGDTTGNASIPAAEPAPAPAPAPASDTTPATTPSAAPAGNDANPFDVPAGGDVPFDPNFNPGLDAGMPEIPTPAPAAPARPDYKPPAVDAYVDLALTHTDVSSFTFSDTAGGYRFIVGFQLEKPVYDQLHIAPEVGYLRIGRAQDQQSVSSNNVPIPQYVNTTTTTRQVDMSSLQFDVRGDYPLYGAVNGYARVGVHFYHMARTTETVITYTPIAPNTTPRDPDTQDSSSITDIGSGMFGTLGLSYSLGKVPSMFAEYGSYRIGNNILSVAAFGFLLNF